jgi:cell division protein FtsI/penicillin-binding protein 2
MRSGAGPKTRLPAASIEGAPLDQAKTPPSPAPAPQQVAAPDGPVELDLDHMELVDGHYIAPTRDGRIAALTLDPELQQLAEKLLDQSRAPRGAIVAMAPDGRILAFAGRRTEDTKGGTDGIRDTSLVTSVWAPAASVFKLVTASALLSNGYEASKQVCYHGGIRSVMESNLTDSKRDNNCETLGYGVAHSNNAILGKLAYQNLQPALLDRTARDLGWTNTLPDSLGVKATCGELDLPHDHDLAFAKSAAGFAGSRLSVLGGAVLASTFADGGEQPTPYIIEAVAGKLVAPPPRHRVLPASIAEEVGKMMVGTCESGSAAKSFRKDTVTVAGKTGTLSIDEPFYMEHSWFVGYAPADAPKVIVSVLLGNPEKWHLRGHEAAKRMIDRAVGATPRAEDRGSKHRRR